MAPTTPIPASYPLNFRLPIRLAERLQLLAVREQTSLSAVARSLLSQAVDRELTTARAE